MLARGLAAWSEGLEHAISLSWLAQLRLTLRAEPDKAVKPLPLCAGKLALVRSLALQFLPNHSSVSLAKRQTPAATKRRPSTESTAGSGGGGEVSMNVHLDAML